MGDGNVQKLMHVIVGESVEHLLALAACRDQPCLLQNPKLMGDRRLVHGQNGGKIAHAHLVAAEHHQNADSGGVPEDLVKFRQLKQGVLYWKIVKRE